jgi:hypothetical protein
MAEDIVGLNTEVARLELAASRSIWAIMWERVFK